MFRKWFWIALAFLFILSIFVLGGLVIYKAGYVLGITEDLRTAETGQGISSSFFGSCGGFLLLLPFAGMFLFILFLLLLFGVFHRLAHYSTWKSAGKPTLEEIRQRWSSVHPRFHHPCDGWGREATGQQSPESDKNPDEQRQDAEPES
jgi:hypothetical protein